MKKYLIFRSDRIGDFLLTAILIKSIKRNNPDSHITIVGSTKNYTYIKSFHNVDQVFLLKNHFFYKIKFILKMRKYSYDYIIVHDEKNRSLLLSKFCNYKTRVVIDETSNFSYIDKIKKILSILNYDFIEQDLDFLNNRNYLNNKVNKEFTLFHFDEKWIFNDYITSYKNIEPSEYQLKKFVESIYLKTNKNLIITTGIKTPPKLNNVIKDINNSNITLLSNITFNDLESLVVKSCLVISCHGAISHIASAKNIRQIDIIDFKKLEFYRLWTRHFRNHNFVYRKNFDELANDIYKLL